MRRHFGKQLHSVGAHIAHHLTSPSNVFIGWVTMEIHEKKLSANRKQGGHLSLLLQCFLIDKAFCAQFSRSTAIHSNWKKLEAHKLKKKLIILYPTTALTAKFNLLRLLFFGTYLEAGGGVTGGDWSFFNPHLSPSWLRLLHNLNVYFSVWIKTMCRFVFCKFSFETQKDRLITLICLKLLYI